MEVTQCPSTEERMDKMWCELRLKWYSAFKGKEGRVMAHAYDPGTLEAEAGEVKVQAQHSLN